MNDWDYVDTYFPDRWTRKSDATKTGNKKLWRHRMVNTERNVMIWQQRNGCSGKWKWWCAKRLLTTDNYSIPTGKEFGGFSTKEEAQAMALLLP